jgi:hypothetical protein
VKLEAQYICLDTNGREAYHVTSKRGLFWLKTETRLAYWDKAWIWEGGRAVEEVDIRIALSEAAYKAGFENRIRL